MRLGYNVSTEFQNEINIEDTGNFSLHCMSATRKLNWFVIVRTMLGTTTIVEFGPEVFTADLIQNGYDFCVKKLDYDEDKIMEEVSKFVNKRTKRKNIQIVTQISYEEAVGHIRDLRYYFNNYGEEYY